MILPADVAEFAVLGESDVLRAAARRKRVYRSVKSNVSADSAVNGYCFEEAAGMCDILVRVVFA